MSSRTVYACDFCGKETEDPPDDDGFTNIYNPWGATELACPACRRTIETYFRAFKKETQAGYPPMPVGTHVPENARCPTCRSPYPNYHPWGVTEGLRHSFVDPKSPAAHNPPVRICRDAFHNEDK